MAAQEYRFLWIFRFYTANENADIIKDPVRAWGVSFLSTRITVPPDIRRNDKDIKTMTQSVSDILVTFNINPGETVAIVGHTGAGKSTLINILTRFYDINKGSILLDGIDIRKVDKRDLRKYISIVLQDVYLFSGSIESNINMDNEEISLDQIISSAKTVGADKFISNLPNFVAIFNKFLIK